MSYMGGVDPDEREMFHVMLSHFALKLNEERRRAEDLERRLDCAEARIRFYEASHYGVI